MYQALSDVQKRDIRRMFNDDNLFRVLSQVIWQDSPWMIAPEDVWTEALNVVRIISATEEADRQMEIRAMYVDLRRRFSCIDSGFGAHHYDSSDDEPRQMAMWVLLSAMYMILDKHPTIGENPVAPACGHIVELLKPIPGFHSLHEAFRKAEDSMEAKGSCIALMDYDAPEFETSCPVQAVIAPKKKGAPMQTLENVLSDVSQASHIRKILKEALDGLHRKDAFNVIAAALKLKLLTQYPAYPVLKKEFDIGFGSSSYSSYQSEQITQEKLQAAMRMLKRKLQEYT